MPCVVVCFNKYKVFFIRHANKFDVSRYLFDELSAYGSTKSRMEI